MTATTTLDTKDLARQLWQAEGLIHQHIQTVTAELARLEDESTLRGRGSPHQLIAAVQSSLNKAHDWIEDAAASLEDADA